MVMVIPLDLKNKNNCNGNSIILKKSAINGNSIIYQNTHLLSMYNLLLILYSKT